MGFCGDVELEMERSWSPVLIITPPSPPLLDGFELILVPASLINNVQQLTVWQNGWAPTSF